MIVPWGTDAPIYHWPKATVALISANVLAFIAFLGLPKEDAARLLLWHGLGLHPLQWITSNFIHADRAFSESVAPMRVYVRRHPEKGDRVRLKLAQVLIRDQRPGQALRVLGEMAGATLPEPLRKVHQQLNEESARMREEGVQELESND